MTYSYYILFALVLLLIITECFSFLQRNIHTMKLTKKLTKKSTKKLTKTILNSFEYDHGEYSTYNQLELINWNDSIDPDNLYCIIGHKNIHYYLLVNEIQMSNICCIFIPISTYQLEDIDYIFSDIINLDNNITKPEINDIKKFNDFLIFDQNKYIGGLFEMYSLLYKDI